MASAIRSEARSVVAVAFSKARVCAQQAPICADFRNQISQTKHEATIRMTSTTRTNA